MTVRTCPESSPSRAECPLREVARTQQSTPTPDNLA